jgi:hypothetical protein
LRDQAYPTVAEEAAKFFPTLGGVGDKTTLEVEDDADHLLRRPMHVHVFEYVARGALLRWWKTLSSNSSASTAPASHP